MLPNINILSGSNIRTKIRPRTKIQSSKTNNL